MWIILLQPGDVNGKPFFVSQFLTLRTKRLPVNGADLPLLLVGLFNGHVIRHITGHKTIFGQIEPLGAAMALDEDGRADGVL